MRKKTVLVMDGQGGRVGRLLIEAIRRECDVEILAVGTNSIATSNMIKGGADRAATGENPVLVAARTADVIIGPVGIVVADALLGEVTPAMAAAVGQSRAVRILIPMNRCETQIVGVAPLSTSQLLDEAVCMVKKVLQGGDCSAILDRCSAEAEPGDRSR
jgi:hypothetical protein